MRHKRRDRPVKKNLALPTSIVDRVNEQLRDPLTQRPTFGAWAALVSGLLVKWLNGEVQVAVPLKKVRPFCHKCLLDKELYHTCNDRECAMIMECPSCKELTFEPASVDMYKCFGCHYEASI